MKNCTKLHFTAESGTNTIEDFFLGGALLYEDNKVKYTVVNNSNQSITYILDSADQTLFMDTVNLITVQEGQQIKTYAKILPIYDAQSLKQNLECRCSIIKGELPYDVRLGIPLKALNEDRRISILNIINKTPGVQNCSVIKSYLHDKKYIIELKIQSNFGEFVMSLS